MLNNVIEYLNLISLLSETSDLEEYSLRFGTNKTSEKSNLMSSKIFIYIFIIVKKIKK